MALSLKFVSTAVWYVPEIADNRTSENPFRVLLAPLSGAEYEALVLSNAFGSDDSRSAAIVALRDRWIPEKVLKVENLELVDETGVSHSPADGADLLAFAKKCDRETMDLLLWDIVAAIQNKSHLEVGLAKKS